MPEFETEDLSFSKQIFLPYQLFEFLPTRIADELQAQIMDLYFAKNPEKLNAIVRRAKGDEDLVGKYKDEEFGRLMYEDYGFDVNILRSRNVMKLLMF